MGEVGRVDEVLAALGHLAERRGLSMAALHAEVERRAGGEVRVLEAEADADLPCGLWLRRDDGPDLVVVDAAASPLHRRHIVLHEYAHVLLGHRTSTSSTFPRTAALAARVLGGAAGRPEPDDARREADAERLAVALARMVLRDGAAPAAPDDERAARLAQVLG